MLTAPPRKPRKALSAALAALALLYLGWFHDGPHVVAALIVFVLPILLLLAGTVRGNATAAFWAGVLGLFLFCHGVMTAWAEPDQRGFASAAIVLSLLLVFASSWPGLRARFGRRDRGGTE